jgi:N-acetylated-alpha-linked acidic dipeptidase
LKAEKIFLAVPDAALAKEHLRTLTAEPHTAGSPEDKKTADYVLKKFKEAGLDAYIQEYKGATTPSPARECWVEVAL